MNRRIVLPAAIVGAAGLLGGAAGVAAWEAVDDDPVATTTAASTAAVPTADSTGSASSLAEMYRRVAPGVVEIQTGGSESGPDEGFDPFSPEEGDVEPAATGSGFVIDEEGHIVTNQHVVGRSETVTVRFAPEPPNVMAALGTRAVLEELADKLRLPAAVSASPTVNASAPVFASSLIARLARLEIVGAVFAAAAVVTVATLEVPELPALLKAYTR